MLNIKIRQRLDLNRGPLLLEATNVFETTKDVCDSNRRVILLGRGAYGQVVCGLALYSDDLSSSLAEIYNLYSLNRLNRRKINKK